MEKELLKIYNIATKYAEKKGGRLANYKDAEDFGSYCLERKLKDQYSTLYWMFIDFVREDTGRGERGFNIRKKNIQYATSLDARRGTGESECSAHDFVGHEEPDFGIRSDAALVECYLREQSKRVNQIFYFRKIGLSFKEIGKKFSITESRVFQIFSHHSEKIKKEKKKGIKRWVKNYYLEQNQMFIFIS